MRVATRSGLKHDLDAAVRLVAEDLVSVRGVFERQVVGGELADAERVTVLRGSW